MKQQLLTIATAVALAAAFGTAQARDNAGPLHPRQDARHQAAGVRLDCAAPAQLREAYSAEHLLAMDVASTQGKPLGEVENIIISGEGDVSAIVVNAAGVLGVGDSSFRIPWKHVDPDVPRDRLVVPLTAANVERFLWGAADDRSRQSELLASSILAADVARPHGGRAAEVEDLIIGRDGSVQAVVISSGPVDGTRHYACRRD